MNKYTHNFIENYDDLIGFGMNRKTNEHTVTCYLQMFSDDTLLQAIVPRMSDTELENMFETISDLLRKHLTEPEYHRLFLKDESSHSGE